MESETRPNAENETEKRKVDILEVLVKSCTGTVKWYSHKLFYGFISRKDNQEDVFVHRTAISASNARTPNLRNGEEVEFSVVRTTNGVEAYNVTGPDGAAVQGFQLMRRQRRGRRGPTHPSGDAIANGDTTEIVSKEGANRRPRRRPRRGRGGAPRNSNGTHSEGDVYYEAGANDEDASSPTAGESRPNKPAGRFYHYRRGRGGYRGGRGGSRPPSYGGRGRGAKRGGSTQATEVS